MVEKRKLNKRGFVTEDDMSTLLQRYTAFTMLTLLQEVGQVNGSKIDWNDLVKNTATGITSAREYQMVWRHLAYRKVLLDKFDDNAQPMDDDSDLEYELESFPPVSSEASTEAAAWGKVSKHKHKPRMVFIASGALRDSNMSNGNTVEASLTIQIPNGQTSGTVAANSLQGISAFGKKLTVPVTVQTQPMPSVSAAEGLDTSGPASANLPRRRRKAWTGAEDMELITAVQKYGEGNWANILKTDFKGDRTASQLSQRWATIRKQHVMMVGNGSHLSEAQLAARHAVSMAFRDNVKAACPISPNAGTNSGSGPSNSSHFAAAADVASAGPQSKHQQDLVPSKPIIPKIPLPKPAINPDPMVKAAAMAASSRVATHSGAAASLQKAALSKKGIHIMPGGTPAVKSSVPGSFNGLPSNVHFMRTGLVSRPAGPSNVPQSGTQQLQAPRTQQLQAPRSVSPAVQPKPTTVPSRTNASSGVRSAPSSYPTTALDVKSKAAVSQENQIAVLSNTRGEKTQVIQAASLGNTPQQQVPKDQNFGDLLFGKVEGQTSVLGDTVKKLGAESKASRIWVQEKLTPSQETTSNKK